jgi:hypothetical protein
MRCTVAHLILGGLLLFSITGCSRKAHVITGYNTQIVFVANDDYAANNNLQDLTRSGWEIKSSRRAWTKDPYHEERWGTEYTLQKAIYDNSTPRTSSKEKQPVTAAVQPEIKEKINPVVDFIHGFASFTLGAPSSDYSSRVEIPPEDPASFTKGLLNEAEGKVVQYKDNERQWATFPVQEVVLRFQEELVSLIRVKVAGL